MFIIMEHVVSDWEHDCQNQAIVKGADKYRICTGNRDIFIYYSFSNAMISLVNSSGQI